MKILRFRSGRRGFTLLEILIVVAILGILVGLAMPNFLKSRYRARQQMCIENLSQIESAKQIWGVENAKKEGDVPSDAELIGPSLYMKKAPVCAGGGIYSLNAIGSNAGCTLSTEGHSL
ncbi:MAG TPA: prepilin-type N-terminal cleavage/methylation domain-containing protein [Verrucomicrobiae bacterium]|nr:prepilin-type N-terminal cleavage/methylation domain-containing protein [Verrucomicrobiae bacterium]